MPYQTHFHLTLLLLIALSSYTNAQPTPSPENYGSPIPTNAIIIVAVVISFGLLTCCARQVIACCNTYVFGPTQEGRNANDNNAQSRRRETPHGLDPSIIAAFPTFLFSDVKVHLVSNTTPLECAICLHEFVDHDHLRLLPRCSHVFHPHCISPWLVSNVTCPVCRANLEIQVDGQNSPTLLAQVLLQPYEDELLGTMSDEQSLYPPCGADDVIVHLGSSPEVILKSPILDTGNNGAGERRGFFPRSHSTGHSLVEDRDKYTLRLPDEVRNKLVNINNNLSGLPNAIVSPRTGYRSRRSNSCAMISGKPDQWRFTMSPPFISRSGSTGIAESSNNNSDSNNNIINNNLGVFMRSPRSFFKSMKSPKRSALNRIGRCDDIGERSSDRLWSNSTPQEIELEHH